MTKPKQQADYPAIEQAFSVRFDYPVLFVRSAFDPGARDLAAVFDRLQEGRRPRVAVCLDEGLAAAGHGDGALHAVSVGVS